MKFYKLLFMVSIILIFSLASISCVYVSGEIDDYEERLSRFISFHNEFRISKKNILQMLMD